MLVEIRSPIFRTGTVSFHEGLNVILGDANATNSIGKSSLLMIVDFALGGTSLLDHNTDLVDELGHHFYAFTFRFNDTDYRFRRGTRDAGVIQVCDEAYSPQRTQSLQEFTAFLFQAYSIDLPDITFRALVGLYLRVWGKDNLSVSRPLHTVQAQAPSECVENLIKTFDKYASLRDLSEQLKSISAELKAFKAAVKNDLVPKVSKKQYAANSTRIAALEDELNDIRSHLAQYATNLSAVVNKEILGLKLEKDKLLDVRLTLSGRLQRVQLDLTETRLIRSDTFKDLIKYFPTINQVRLATVEDFHNGVARALRQELKLAASQIEQQIDHVDSRISQIDAEMTSTLQSVKEPTVIVDRVLKAAMALKDVRDENARYDEGQGLELGLRTTRGELAVAKRTVLGEIQAIVNGEMRRIATAVFGEDHKSPVLTLNEHNYSFDVYEDTGTGTAYVSLVLFDLAVFLQSKVPAIAHDSVLFKNIENQAVARLLNAYRETNKQSFIALDEVDKYGREAAALLRSCSVIQLDNEQLLFTKDWRTQSR